jgi:hypothetical protein
MKVVASGADWSRADGGAREGVVDRLCGRLWLELDPKRSPGVIDEQTAWRLLQLLYVVRGTTIYGGPIVWPLELLEAWTSLLPTRIVNEEAGDYVELILTDCSQGRHRVPHQHERSALAVAQPSQRSARRLAEPGL